MKKDLFDFSDFDNKIVENIADNYPDMDKSEQKAICGKVRKRLDMTENSTFADAVSGVEPAKKPILRYVLGTAAAAVFAIAVIPLALKALKNSPDAPENIQESRIITDYNASPTENEDNSAEAVTTKIGKSDITARVTTPESPTDELVPPPTTPEKSKDAEDKEKAERTEAPPAPPVTEVKKTTEKLHGTVPQTPPVPTAPPKTTKPVNTTTKPVTAPPAPPTPPAISEDGIFNTLANLSYSPYTCDGIADYILTAEDGTIYQILVGCKHVWRNGSEEADITPEILEWVKKYGEPYKVKDHNAKAEIDWSWGDFTDNAWSVTYSDYSKVITNTGELREYLEKIYRDDKVEQYLNQYNDSYFKSSVLALKAVQQSAGARNMLEIKDFAVNNSEIKLTANWKDFDVVECIVSINLVKLEIPKHMYVNQPIYWNITKESSVVNNQATAEIDWRYYDFGGFNDYDDGLVDRVWNENTSGNLIITNTTDFCDSLSDVYSENQIKEYTDKYNNDFFDNNVLLIYYKYIPNGRDDKIYMDNIEVSDNEININATYKTTGRALLAPYVCVIHVTVPKDIYNEQEIYWNISEQFKIQ